MGGWKHVRTMRPAVSEPTKPRSLAAYAVWDELWEQATTEAFHHLCYVSCNRVAP